MKNDLFPKYFLAANACGGFYSEFSGSYSANDHWKAYIIKGGPGTGKSTLMKKAAARAAEKGIPFELFPCSSDPTSLDGVAFPTKKVIILDGTAPHVVEPKYPALCEQIINMGDFWDEKKLCGREKDLIELTDINKAYHKKASQYITVAGQIMKYNFGVSLSAADIDKAYRFGCSLAKQHIPKKGGAGRESIRFLSGYTPEGFVFYGNTINSVAKKQIVVSDKYGAVSSIIFSSVRDYAKQNGHKIITVKSCLLPDDIIDHIIIPDLSLAFCREAPDMPIDSTERRIHARRFVSNEVMAKNRQKLNFNRRITKELLIKACENLKAAKAIHDQMEKYYIDIMDFESLNTYTDKITDKIFCDF